MSEPEIIESTPTPIQRAMKLLEDWMIWSVVTGIGWITGLALAVTLIETLLAGMPDGMGLFLARLGGGALLGTLQWAYLLRGRARLPQFLPGSALAWPLALLVFDVVLQGSLAPWRAALGGLLGGAVMGFVQTAFIDHAGERRTWLPSNVAGWVIALAVGRQAVVDEVSPAASSWQYSVPLGIGWVFLAMMAVVAIVLLFPRQKLSGKDIKLPMWPSKSDE